MEQVFDELDEVKTEMEKLKEECRVKTELSESLRKAHSQQLVKVKESNLVIERQTQELNAKSEEISELRQLYEDLKSDLLKKDSFLENLSSAHEKNRVDFSEKISKLEGEYKGTVIALDEATLRIRDLEKQVCVSNEEINGLKRLLSSKQNKSIEEEKNSRDLKARDEVILKLEEENRKVQDQLKWKNEQFEHLEEAHEKLQDQFQMSKVESENEKSGLFQEISSLQTSLDSQIRISESFQTQLQMCNKALAHEETRRKVVEIELSEFKSRYDNVYSEYEEAKSMISQLTVKRDEEIGELRNVVRAKETLFKEISYRNSQLELENQELRGSVKELHEAQLNDAALSSSSLRKMKNKLHSLEQLHSKCIINLKENEAKWSSQIKCSISEVKDKEKQIKTLQSELEIFDLLTEAHEILMVVFKSELDVAYSKFFTVKSELESCEIKNQEKITYLTEQLVFKDEKLSEIYADLKQKCEEKTALMERIELLDSSKEKQICLNEEVKMYKEKLDESNESKSRLEKEVHEMESVLEEQRKDALNDLQKVKCELANKNVEIENLEDQIKFLKLENEGYMRNMEEKNLTFEKLELEIARFKQTESELENVKLEKFEAEKGFKKEKEDLLVIIEENNRRMKNLERVENGKILEMENKNKIIKELEIQVNDLRTELESQKISIKNSESEMKQINALLLANKTEAYLQKLQFENEFSCFEGIMEELKSKNEALVEDIKRLSAEKGSLIVEMEGISKQFNEICGKDVDLSEMLGKIACFSDDEPNDFIESPILILKKGIEGDVDERVPLTELNC